MNRQIVGDGDLLIGIFGNRLGTATGVAASGTLEEIEEFRKTGRYIALYFSIADVPRDADRMQLDAVASYKKAREKDTLLGEFKSAAELHQKLVLDLTKIVGDVGRALHLGIWRDAVNVELEIRPAASFPESTDRPSPEAKSVGKLTSRLQVRIFDGSRRLFVAPADFLITIFDGNQKMIHRDFHKETVVDFDCPFHDSLGDLYSVTVWCDGHRQVGFVPVKLSNQTATTLDIMLVASVPGFNFVNARWASVAGKFPFWGSDTNAATAQARFENLMEYSPKVIACFLNLAEAMGQILLADGTPLDYIKQIRWDRAPRQDRFFAYCDAKLVDQVRDAGSKGLFSRADGSAQFHIGSTKSWKQIQFGEANLQLTFHENPPDRKTINGVDCVTLEPDMAYLRDPGAHMLCEVIPNALTHSLTDPVDVYVLRWFAGQHAGVPQFGPLYTLTNVRVSKLNRR